MAHGNYISRNKINMANCFSVKKMLQGILDNFVSSKFSQIQTFWFCF